MDKQSLAHMLELFLQLNPTPSDAQFHQLAGALGCDKEELEAVAYQMLGEEVQHEKGEGDYEQLEDLEVNASGDVEPSEAQDVLDGDYDPQTTTSDDLALNDGAPAGTSSQQGNQDATLNDGVAESDMGIDLDSGKDDMITDGIVPFKLRAAARLRVLANDEFIESVQADLKHRGLAADLEDGVLKVDADPDDFAKAAHVLKKTGKYKVEMNREDITVTCKDTGAQARIQML